MQNPGERIEIFLDNSAGLPYNNICTYKKQNDISNRKTRTEKHNMKVKYSIIPFIPAALAMIILRVMSVFGADESGKVFGMDKMTVSYTVIGIALCLFVVCIVINIFDRKTAPVYPVKRNPVAGILSILSGAAVIASSVGTFMSTTTDTEYYIMTLICAIFSVPAGIAFMLMSRVHFLGKSIVSGVSMLFVFPALWGCSELVYQFLDSTKVSISASDMTSMFCFIFITLYYFSHSMVISRIKGRNPVKGCFIYGLPAVTLVLSHGCYTLFTGMKERASYTVILNAVMMFALGLYALCFIIELFANTLSKDELEIIDGLPAEAQMQAEEGQYIATNDYDDLVVAGDVDTDETESTDTRSSEYYQSAQGLDDFIIGYQPPQDDEPVPYLTRDEMQRPKEESFITGTQRPEMPAEEPAEELQPPVVQVVDQGTETEKPVIKPLMERKEPEQPNLSDVEKLLDELNSKE